jgi:formate--tetrahydrofolate ligase
MTNTLLMTHTLLPIQDVAQKLGLRPEEYETIGTYGAKLKLGLLDNPAFPVRGKFILVTATTPTTSGEGRPWFPSAWPRVSSTSGANPL